MRENVWQLIPIILMNKGVGRPFYSSDHFEMWEYILRG